MLTIGLVTVGKADNRRYYDLTEKGRHVGKLCLIANKGEIANLADRMALFVRHLSEDNLHGTVMEWFPDLAPKDWGGG